MCEVIILFLKWVIAFSCPHIMLLPYQHTTRFGVFTAVKIYFMIFWIMALCRLTSVTNVSEEHAPSSFKVEVKTETAGSSETLVITQQTTRQQSSIQYKIPLIQKLILPYILL
jgi:hypothetical protein